MVLKKFNHEELQCCLFCGQDTFNFCQICDYCLGEKEQGCKSIKTEAWEEEFISRGCELEDRYDEESGPDDVWPDWEPFE